MAENTGWGSGGNTPADEPHTGNKANNERCQAHQENEMCTSEGQGT